MKGEERGRERWKERGRERGRGREREGEGEGEMEQREQVNEDESRMKGISNVNALSCVHLLQLWRRLLSDQEERSSPS